MFSNEKDHGWTKEKENRELVESAAFGLLASLCDGSSKGRKEVAAASSFHDCFNRAQDILAGVASGSSAGVEDPIDSKESESSSAEEENEDEKMDSSSNDAAAVSLNSILIRVDNEKLLASAFSFLSTMVQLPTVRSHLLKNEKFVTSAAALATERKFVHLQFQAVKVVSRLASCSSTDGLLPPDRVGSILQAALALETEPDGKESSESFSINSLHVLAAEGMEYVFNSLSEDQQKSVVKDITSRYRKVLKSHSIARSNTNGSVLENGGELAFNLTTILMMANCKNHLEECFDSLLLTALINTVQWRYDPKTVISKEELRCWDATTTQSLQIISLVLWREDGKLEKSRLTPLGLLDTVLMVARPGKAPRKAIDFASVLSIVAEHGEAAAALSAKRVQKCLGI